MCGMVYTCLMGIGRPKDSENMEYMGYEITVRFPYRIGDFLDKLPKGDKGKYIREAVDEKIKQK